MFAPKISTSITQTQLLNCVTVGGGRVTQSGDAAYLLVELLNAQLLAADNFSP